MRKEVILLTILLCLPLFLLCSEKKGQKKKGNNQTTLIGTRGTYGSPPRDARMQVDFKKLIAELKDIHANTYHWLIRDNNDDLNVVKTFLPSARRAGINVWVTMVPPSESPPVTKRGYSEPYRLDFEKWAVELAKLSLSEPNLIAWSIDDFVHNLDFFTPEYVRKFTSLAKGINPEFKFIPCCYYKKTTSDFAEKYGSYLDGILFPYRDESDKANLTNSSKVQYEIEQLRKMFPSSFPVIIDIYATAHSRLGASTPEYVKEVLESGLEYADGVLIYCHQDPIKNAEKYQIIKHGFESKNKF